MGAESEQVGWQGAHADHLTHESGRMAGTIATYEVNRKVNHTHDVNRSDHARPRLSPLVIGYPAPPVTFRWQLRTRIAEGGMGPLHLFAGTGRRHAGAPSGGCSSTRGLYSTSWMRPSKVRCSIISRATSG